MRTLRGPPGSQTAGFRLRGAAGVGSWYTLLLGLLRLLSLSWCMHPPRKRTGNVFHVHDLRQEPG